MTKKILWDNVLRLMLENWGRENLNRLSRESGVASATCTRLKTQETSVGLEVIEKIAAALGSQHWQLLVPAEPEKDVLTKRSFKAQVLASSFDALPDSPTKDTAFSICVHALDLAKAADSCL